MADVSISSTVEETADELNLALRKKFRLTEFLIQVFLFSCGILSILVTLGIVIILANESLAFFIRYAYVGTNKELEAAYNETATEFEVSTSGSDVEVGDLIRIGNGDELMLVEAFEPGLVTVARGQEGTEATEHRAGEDIQVAERPTLAKVFGGSRWTPQLGQFGMWPLILSTLMISVIAMTVALPLGLASAIYLSEYASDRTRSILKPILEVLAGVPTVVYGYFALTFMTPLLKSIFGDVVNVYNTASAGIVVGVLIIPLVSSMSEDALHAVPDSLRQASFGLGATKLETSLRVVLPAALSGITAAFVVAISRAIGETMIVAVAAGAGPRNFDWADVVGNITETPFFPFRSAETMTGHIVRISGGDLSYNSIDYNSIFSIGLVLFMITLLLNLASRRIVERFREVYD